MPVFKYKAYDGTGKLRKGTIDEESRKAALERLKQQKLVPVDVAADSSAEADSGSASRQIFSRSRVSLKDVALFTRQVSTLVTAGLPLVEALTATVETAAGTGLQSVAAGVRDRVNEGASLAEALRKYPRVFNDLYVNMVRAGEESGTLEIVLERLADFLDNQLELRNKLSGALAYPLIMALMMCGVVGVLFVFVIPKIVEVFDQTGAALPLPTRVLIFISESIQQYGVVMIIVLILTMYAWVRFINSPGGRAWWDPKKLKMPLLGPVSVKVAVSRFSRTLSTLLGSGVSLPVSLKIVREVVGNVVYADAVDQVYESVVEGGGLAKPLKGTGVFPPNMVRMVAAGEQSGELEDMLARVATANDRDVDMQLNIMTRLMEPILTVFMGGLVFFIMLSIMIPLFRMNEFI